MGIKDLISYAEGITTSTSNVDKVLDTVLSYGRGNGFTASSIEEKELKQAIKNKKESLDFDKTFGSLFDTF